MQRPSLFQLCLKAIRQRSFYTAYYNTFEIKKADTPPLRDAAFRLRYQIYRLENGPRASLHYKDAIEKDLYDDHAAQYLLVHKPSNTLAGSVRVVFPDRKNPARSFPAQNVCDHPYIHSPEKAMTLCEISSLCVAPQFRRRPEDGQFLPAYHDQDWRVQFSSGKLSYLRRRIPYAPLGLLQAAFEATLNSKRLECILVIEPAQLRSLEQIGMIYRVLGPKIEQHGLLQQPIIFDIKHSFDNMLNQSPHCWDVVSDMGRLHRKANTLYLNNWEDTLFDDACVDLIYNKLM